MSKTQHTASRATHLEAPAHLPRAPYAAHVPIDPSTGLDAGLGLLNVRATSGTLEGQAHVTERPSWALQQQALPASVEHLE